MLLLNLSDTAATSQDRQSLEFIAAFVGRQCNIQDASGRGLWTLNLLMCAGFLATNDAFCSTAPATPDLLITVYVAFSH